MTAFEVVAQFAGRKSALFESQECGDRRSLCIPPSPQHHHKEPRLSSSRSGNMERLSTSMSDTSRPPTTYYMPQTKPQTPQRPISLEIRGTSPCGVLLKGLPFLCKW